MSFYKSSFIIATTCLRICTEAAYLELKYKQVKLHSNFKFCLFKTFKYYAKDFNNSKMANISCGYDSII